MNNSDKKSLVSPITGLFLLIIFILLSVIMFAFSSLFSSEGFSDAFVEEKVYVDGVGPIQNLSSVKDTLINSAQTYSVPSSFSFRQWSAGVVPMILQA